MNIFSTTKTMDAREKYVSYIFSVVLVLPVFLNAEAGYESEARALLKWKSSLTNQTSLSSWTTATTMFSNTTTLSSCSWYGVFCTEAGSVTEINLPEASLQGKLENLNFSSLPNLVHLNLSCNNFNGNVPMLIGTLSKLTHLDLSVNSFTGILPLSLSNLTRIVTINVSYNSLSGELDPFMFTNWTRLVVLGLQNNGFTGIIPSKIELLSNLKVFSLSYNQLRGIIPPQIGNLKSLVVLAFRGNFLSGPIPQSLGNLSNIEVLYLDQNELYGSVPSNIGTLKDLVDLRLFRNQLSGSLPQEIGNLSSLSRLHLNDNNFSGNLPQELCRGRSLTYLAAANNHFSGPIPKSLKNCTTFFRVRLEGNHLTGNVSQDFGLYTSLTYIDLRYNKLTGELSPSWGEYKDLTALQICCNEISGRIPKGLGNLTELQLLDLSANHLVGAIPKDLINLHSLFSLNLSGNQLSGEILPEIEQLTNLEFLDLSMNTLSGSIPEQIGDCTKLLSLSFANNKLTGTIPYQIGNLVNLQDLLDLSHNALTGDLSPQFSKLVMLEKINLSHNGLTGSIPSSFSQMVSLITIDLSNNYLEGRLPSAKVFEQAPSNAFANNKGLFRDFGDLPPSSSPKDKASKGNGHTGLITVIGSIIGTLFVVLVFIGIFFLKKTIVPSSGNGGVGLANDNIFSIWNYDGVIVYENIIESTNDFHDDHCIGTGGTGRVYKAELATGQVFAIKKLYTQEGEEHDNLKCFMNEIQVLAEVRHRNIVKLYGFCSHSRHTFLVYEYMERGSLASIISTDTAAREFDWVKRLNAIKSIANGLSYMHHDCTPPIIHRDITSNNVLLNSEFEACISDFGIARFSNPETLSWTTIAGTKGYMAPELAYTMLVTEKCDIYSFGVLTLEVIMGRHPREVISLPNASMSLMDMLDLRLLPPEDPQVVEQISSTFMLALACLHSNPHSRPTMRQVSQSLSTMVFSSEDHQRKAGGEGFGQVTGLHGPCEHTRSV